jgi:hypothetical protein
MGDLHFMEREGLQADGPRTAAERAVMEVWASVLGTPVGREDNFFRQGGDSLSATRVIARLKQVQGYSSSVGVLLNNPTLHRFAALLVRDGDAQRVRDGDAQRYAAAEDGDIVAPLSDAQQAFWDILQREPAAAKLCEILEVIHVSGELDDSALQHAVDTVTARHEALRSTVRVRSLGAGEPVQVIHPPAPVKVLVHDLTALGADAFAQACRRALEDGSHPFDLSRERPFRFGLYRCGPAENLLVVKTHHMFFDGQSMSILRRELAACYAAHVSDQPVDLPAPVPYRAYVATRAELKTAATMARYQTFWREYLSGFGHQNLPTDFARPAVPTFAAQEVTFDLPPAALNSVNAFCARHQVTRFSALVGTFAASLGQAIGVDDLLVGVSVAQRTLIEHESTIGELTNTVPLRFRWDAGAGAASLCRSVARDFGVVLGYSDIHYRALLPELRENQGFQVRFSLHDAISGEPADPGFAGLRTETVVLSDSETVSNRDVRWDVWDSGSALRCVLTYRSELYRRESMERVARLIVDNLTALR